MDYLFLQNFTKCKCEFFDPSYFCKIIQYTLSYVFILQKESSWTSIPGDRLTGSVLPFAISTLSNNFVCSIKLFQCFLNQTSSNEMKELAAGFPLIILF